MTLNGVLALQLQMLDAGSKSTACGRYQFLRKTLLATIAQMGLTGEEVWSRDLQDRMALHLIEARGLRDYLAGLMSREAFANRLAMEWASLPVVTVLRGAHRMLKPGQSYYAGDGLNKALHDPAAILALVDALRDQQRVEPPRSEPAAPAPAQPPAPPVPPPARGFWAAIADWLRRLFK